MYEKRIESPRRYPEYRGLACQRPKYHKQSTEKYRKYRNTAMVLLWVKQIIYYQVKLHFYILH